MKTLVLASLLVLPAAPALAAFYVGGSATTTASEFDTAVDSIDSDELGWKAYAGVDFLDFLGAEVSYRDLGNFSDGVSDGFIDLDLKVIDGSVRAFLPIGPLDLFARGGYARIAWDGVINLENEVENFNEDDWELFYGVGLELKLGDKLALRAEWEKYDVSESLNTLSAGLSYRF
jgi:hypothetical protein